MSKLKTLGDLLVQEIKDLSNAEGQLVKALPKMAKAASQPALKDAFLAHLKETQGHVERLEKVADILGASPRGKTCKAMKGLVEEGAETIEEPGDPFIKDLALTAAAQKVEHYEIAGYGSAKAIAAALGHDAVVALLQATENEEGKADKALTAIAKQIVARAPAAAHA
jgi:ferritin-like metal-binding protein YciE